MKIVKHRSFGLISLIRLAIGSVLTILTLCACFRAETAEAQEIMPYEFSVLPVGTNLALGYYGYGHNTDYSVARGPTFRDSGLETHVGIARFVHYDEIAGMRVGIQAFQVFGGLQDARIGGQSLPNAFGAQNITLSAFFWPYINEDTKTAIIVVGFLNPPTGTYDRFAPLNLGDNRMRGTIQIGLQQGFGENFGLDLAYDAQFYGDNDRAFPGSGILRQEATHRLQAWMNWRWNPSFSTSIGYTGIWGGDQTLNGLLNGTRTEIQRIRFHTGYFIDPTLQVGLELNHDVRAVGGFKQDFGAVFRVLKAF